MQGRGISAVLGGLLVVAVCVIVYLLANRPGASQRAPGSSAYMDEKGARKTPDAKGADAKGQVVPKVDTPVPAPAGLSAKELEAKYAEIRRPEKTKELAALAADAEAAGQKRIEAVQDLAAAEVGPEVLFPLAVKFSEEKEPVFRGVAVEVTASLLERGEKVADEEKAAAILINAAKPGNNSSQRTAAARGLARMRSKAAAEAMVGLLVDEERLARRYAIGALKGLSGGETFGFDYARSPKEQTASVEKWVAWVKTYEPKGQ